MAGTFAKAINAKNLILTHFGGQYTCSFDYIQNVMVPQAQKAFGSPNVHAAKDFWAFNLDGYVRNMTLNQAGDFDNKE